MEDAVSDAEDDVLRRDAAGLNCSLEHLCSKARAGGSACRYREVSKVLTEELRDLMRPEEL